MGKTKKSTPVEDSTGRELSARLQSFLLESFPFVASRIVEAVDRDRLDAANDSKNRAEAIDALRGTLEARLEEALGEPLAEALPDAIPGTASSERLHTARRALIEAVDGFLRRESIAASLDSKEKRELLRGMLLTRATDNRLKAFFLGGEVRYGNGAFQGKGFRSLGQEAVYAAALRLRRGPDQRDADGAWRGDVVAPLIRDLGVALAMHPEAETVRMVLSAQMGKAGAPMDGRDFHIGDLDRGILPAAAPLSISTLNVAGMAMAFAQRGEQRVAVSFIGEGGTSLGEWHEAINLCAVRRLPAIFCVENNQTALSTAVGEQCAARVFADKAAGYGIPGVSVDGTDPEAVAATFAWAAERARQGRGPTLIELIAMRMCGHAHHDDMLYLGREPQPAWSYPQPTAQGYVDRDAYAFWSERDPIASYSVRLEREGVIDAGTLEQWKGEVEAVVERAAREVVEAPWPDADRVGAGVFANEQPRRFVEVLEGRSPTRAKPLPSLPPLDPGPPADPKGRTFLEAVMLGVGDALRADERVFVYGEDVGGSYGNAFLLLRPLLEEFGDRILNSTLAEGGVLGVCTGAALAGLRPIGEIQFNDFVATGFNQLVNNAAKIRYRWGGSVPMVVRMPWGGLRKAGPYHSQNTEPWFYRTPGLKIVAPSTPHDARGLLAASVADPDPVLFYEHIALYREPRIKQQLELDVAAALPLGRAALRRAGDDLALISYGAYVHRALEAAETLAAEGVDAAVLDLRSLVPLDREALLAVARHCGKVLLVHEDSRTGGVGESLAAVIQEECFEDLDAPIRVIGALDAPVPYAPPLEERFLPDQQRILRAARLLAAY